MATKNINLIKKSIFSLLSGDTALQALLGGAGHIHHQHPPQKPQYPHIIYEIITDTDTPFNEDNASGEITESIANITIFSTETGSTESDNIGARIKTLLYKKTSDLTNNDIICYSSLRTGMSSQQLDNTLKIWITTARYKIRWATK